MQFASAHRFRARDRLRWLQHRAPRPSHAAHTSCPLPAACNHARVCVQSVGRALPVVRLVDVVDGDCHCVRRHVANVRERGGHRRAQCSHKHTHGRRHRTRSNKASQCDKLIVFRTCEWHDSSVPKLSARTRGGAQFAIIAPARPRRGWHHLNVSCHFARRHTRKSAKESAATVGRLR
jgi:hypothetical protein